MKVLITRPRAQSESFGEALRTAGFEPIYFPVIEIHPIEENVALERALSKLDRYEWIVFTSVNAVDIVALSGELAKSKGNEGVKVAAVGPSTADALRKYNIEPDFIPEEYVAEAILPGLGDLRGKWVLLPRAEMARKELPEAIFHAGGVPHEIVVYKTLPAQPDLDGLDALKQGVDVVTFTSASTVQNFSAIVKQNGLDPLHLPNDPVFACIGPVTEQAAREEGFSKLVIANEYTADGLIKIIESLNR
ncbi:MAG: uroporphyrinogen-III synthase [Anaerolineales bacterium]|nr:uroporphyrinogen-III synthase [Anaerolineales bacterium]